MEDRNVEEDVKRVLLRLREMRKAKGVSIENMADELQMSTAAYNKIEKQTTKLTLERLLQIRKILDVPLEDLLEIECRTFYHQEIKDQGVGHQEIQTLYQGNKDLYEKLIQAKDEQIALLKEMVK